VINFMVLNHAVEKKVDQYADVPIVTQDPWGSLEIKYAFRCD
jgi:hypothetical protein